MTTRCTLLSTGFDFVAAKALLSFDLLRLDPLERAIFHKLYLVGSVHSIFGCVVMALLASLAGQSDNLSFVAFFSHKK
jgi:hypothetical protein